VFVEAVGVEQTRGVVVRHSGLPKTDALI